MNRYPAVSAPVGSRARRHDFAAGLWRLADPKITLASASSLFLGVAAAASAGPLHLGWLAATVLGIFAIEVAKNASGEIFDFDSGADQAVAAEDRTPFSGGKRVLVDDLLTRRETGWIAAAFYGAGILIGFTIVLWREPRVLWIGLLGVACAYAYHAPPAKLSYRGLGESAVGLCYGPLIATGAYLVQRGTWDAAVVWASLPLGLLIAAFLWINEFPDFSADLAAGKRTLVVRLGRARAAMVYAGLILLAFLILLLLPLFDLPIAVWLGFLGLPPALWAAARLRSDPANTRRLVSAQAASLAAFVFYALGAGLGVLRR